MAVRTHRVRVESSRSLMTPSEVRAAKCSKTKQRNKRRKELFIEGKEQHYKIRQLKVT